MHGIFLSENSYDAKKSLDNSVLLLQKYANCTVTSVICNGSLALTKAQQESQNFKT